ncbi:MAG TPA: hypothetical protein VFX45_06255 [Solirubrobacterales bacterium]|nr:hypothetical protein [Solirubrobacterales bacterium]
MKLRPSPATVIAVIALLVSLTGTAFAAGVFTKKQKKQVTTLATKVFDSKIGGASVKRAETAGRAETADKALTADKATEATKATEAVRATEAARADVATKADEATKATEAATATEAERADEATRAATAADADQLGGKSAGEFQRRVGGSCTPPETISRIEPDGTVACASPVRAVRIELGPASARTVDLGNGLGVTVTCTTPSVSLELRNNGQANGNLNRFVLIGNTSETSGAVLRPGESFSRVTADRAESQFIWSPAGDTATSTLLLHLFHSAGGGFCELTGTVLTTSR